MSPGCPCFHLLALLPANPPRTITSWSAQTSLFGRPGNLQPRHRWGGYKSDRRRSAACSSDVDNFASSRRFYLEAPAVFKPFIGEGYRATLKTELVPGKIWGFEQSQELGALAVNIRSVAALLPSGDLWVHAPLFPTEEYLDQLLSLNRTIAHVVLPTYALEHKIPMSSFLRLLGDRQAARPKLWAVGDTWSFPVNLPLKWLGIPVDGIIGEDHIPWRDHIEFEVLKIADVGNPFVEAVFFHKDTKSLIVTDVVYSVPQDPPEIIPIDLLLEVAPDNPNVKAQDSMDTRRRAWAKMALLVAFFIPARQRIVEGGKAEWKEGYMESFEMIKDRMLVSPILQKLVFEKASTIVQAWIEKISKWEFEYVIPAHYAAPIKGGPSQVKQAFSFAYEDDSPSQLPEEDMRTLNDLGEIVQSVGKKDAADTVYGKLFDKFFKNLFIKKRGWNGDD